jgi:hypothetical protein
VNRSAPRDSAGGTVSSPGAWLPGGAHPPDRHILLGVSHASDDPSRHRVYEVRAAFDAARRGWVARVGEQNRNEQRGDWQPTPTAGGQVRTFSTAAACLGDAVTTIIAAFDADTGSRSETSSGR